MDDLSFLLFPPSSTTTPTPIPTSTSTPASKKKKKDKGRGKGGKKRQAQQQQQQQQPQQKQSSESASATPPTNPNQTLPLLGPVAVSNRNVIHGLGLVVTRDVRPGECLFVTDPTVAADVDTVRRRWRDERRANNGANSSENNGGAASSSGNSASPPSSASALERVAESVLIEEMRGCLSDATAGTAGSFLALTGADKDGRREQSMADDDNDHFDGGAMMETLLGGGGVGGDPVAAADDASDDDLLGIVRRNAFGPDFRNYDSLEGLWTMEEEDGVVDVNGGAPSSSSSSSGSFRRVLGMYPLAAIINHSCVPNAVRVFAGETMLVHACQPIPAHTEVVWSYIPPVKPLGERRDQISTRYGFRCGCDRCTLESEAIEGGGVGGDLEEKLDGLGKFNRPHLALTLTEQDVETTGMELSAAVDELEALLDHKSRISNETGRYLRLGYLNLYLNHFNLARLDDPEARERVLSLATKLHFSFVAAHNGSTEHLSILHLCYELICLVHSASSNPEEREKTLGKVRFWTEQLKRAHLVRYGSMGGDVDRVRDVMKHTRGVLRNLDGLSNAQWCFI